MCTYHFVRAGCVFPVYSTVATVVPSYGLACAACRQVIRCNEVGGVEQALHLVSDGLVALREDVLRTLRDAVAPFIQRYTGDVEVPHGMRAVLDVNAGGNPAPTFQWSRNGAVLYGACDRTLVIDRVEECHEGTYRCLVTNSAGTVLSKGMELSLLSTSPMVTWLHPPQEVVGARGDGGDGEQGDDDDDGDDGERQHARGHVVYPVKLGDEAVFEVDVIGYPPPSVQWYFEVRDCTCVRGSRMCVRHGVDRKWTLFRRCCRWCWCRCRSSSQ